MAVINPLDWKLANCIFVHRANPRYKLGTSTKSFFLPKFIILVANCNWHTTQISYLDINCFNKFHRRCVLQAFFPMDQDSNEFMRLELHRANPITQVGKPLHFFFFQNLSYWLQIPTNAC